MIVNSNSLKIPLKDNSVHCVVTSPPYWALRDYGEPGQLGLEPTPEEYIEKMVQVFREVWRVLRDDGTLWLNLGDTYAAYWGEKYGAARSFSGSRGNIGNAPPSKPSMNFRKGKDCCPKRGKSAIGQPRNKASFRRDKIETISGNAQASGYLKPKDLCGIPWRVVIALQQDGWYWRSTIPWLKRNCMPESANDRPSTAIEYFFLLTKSPRYFYDGEAIRKPASPNTNARMAGGVSENHKNINGAPGQSPHTLHQEKKNRKFDPGANNKSNPSFDAAMKQTTSTRARRNSDLFFETWQGLMVDENNEPLAMIVNSAAFKDAHFATFPEGVVIDPVKAGTSEKGCCAACGMPYQRIVEVTGWEPGCKCGAEVGLCVVYDPFGGSGTVKSVAGRLGRLGIVSDLKFDYCKMAKKRCKVSQVSIDFSS